MNYFCLPKEVGSSCHVFVSLPESCVVPRLQLIPPPTVVQWPCFCITSWILRCAAFTANSSTYSGSVAMFLYHVWVLRCAAFTATSTYSGSVLFVLGSRRACYDTRPGLKRSHSKHRPASSPLELRTILIRTPSELYSGITCTVLLHTPC